jgi:hypothetical protein
MNDAMLIGNTWRSISTYAARKTHPLAFIVHMKGKRDSHGKVYIDLP